MLWLKFEFIKMCGFILFILWVYLLSSVHGKHTVTKRGIMDNINNGIKYAGQIMGINTAADVANLVSKAFAPKTPPKQFDSSFLFETPEKFQNPERDTGTSSNLNPTDMVGSLLRMIGFDAGKLGALAINALLMIAQLIGNSLKKRTYPSTFQKSTEDGRNYDESQHEDEEYSYDDQQDERSGRAHIGDNTPLDWILTNPPKGLSDFFEQITDRKLPDNLAEAVAKLESQNGQGDCIKMLLCKSAPFIWGMQKSVSNRLNGKEQSDEGKEKSDGREPMSILFKNLPDIEEYRRHGDICERRYSNFCNRNGS